MIYLLLLIVFITCLSIVLLILKAIYFKSPIKRLDDFNSPELQSGENKSVKGKKKILKENYGLIGDKFINIFALSKIKNKLNVSLQKANILFKAEEMIFAIFISSISLFLVALIFTANILVSLVFGGGTILFYKVYIDAMVQKRMNKFDEQLPSTVDMIITSLKAGFSFVNSIDIISKDMPAPISEEFGLVLKEVKLGLPMEKALNNLMNRMPSEDLELVVIATSIQMQTGGNLSEILNNISETIRERILLKREVKTLTAQGRASGTILIFLPIVLGIVLTLINPSYMKVLITNTKGLILLIIVVINEIIGFLLIKKLTDVKL
ncbi:type II secretion system F family protein [Clostridium grantii]|uniref:Tight adherence protein B n=1 Tax=Clostridium grantii DSM 8605 TaxID=1121316 RepID=A0A1M5XCR6_9CLOT|nr:type II secretion system F family protein [Clostridium grantii]SHH96993.1 tight adherence protein B [Clostridium grantii DSM 8605]